MDSFTVSATKCARRMATFVKILNKEDISTMDNRDNIREVSASLLVFDMVLFSVIVHQPFSLPLIFVWYFSLP